MPPDRMKNKTAHIGNYVEKMESKEIDYSNYIPLRLNKWTVVMVPPGVDPEEVRKKYQKKK